MTRDFDEFLGMRSRERFEFSVIEKGVMTPAALGRVNLRTIGCYRDGRSSS